MSIDYTYSQTLSVCLFSGTVTDSSTYSFHTHTTASDNPIARLKLHIIFLLSTSYVQLVAFIFFTNCEANSQAIRTTVTGFSR